MMYRNLTRLGIILLLCIAAYFTNWRLRDKLLEWSYDFKNENPDISSKAEIDKALSDLEIITYKDLDQEYLQFSKSNLPKYEKLIRNLKYYKVKRTQLNRKVVGDFRLKEFLCKDHYYRNCVLNRREDLVFILNKKLLYKTLELLEELDKLGYNRYGFYIVNGHRHPSYNEDVGGAKLSRHIKGEAVDITINDINDDGYANKQDKDIVLDLLDKKIIGNQGGIGLYPGSDRVHFDVRGTRARWDTY